MTAGMSSAEGMNSIISNHASPASLSNHKQPLTVTTTTTHTLSHSITHASLDTTSSTSSDVRTDASGSSPRPSIRRSVTKSRSRSRTTGSRKAASSSSYNRVSRLVATVVHLMVQHFGSGSSRFSGSPYEPMQWLRMAQEEQSNSIGRPPAALLVFAQKLISNSKLSLPVILVSLKYVERFLRGVRDQAVKGCEFGNNESAHTFDLRHVTSEYGLLVAALASANKFLDDSRFSNRWWAKVSEIGLLDLNKIEMAFLSGISYDLFLGDAAYVEWVGAMQKFARWLEESSSNSIPDNLSIHSSSSNTAPAIPQLSISSSNSDTYSQSYQPSPIQASPRTSQVPASLPIGLSWNGLSYHQPHHHPTPSSSIDQNPLPSSSSFTSSVGSTETLSHRSSSGSTALWPASPSSVSSISDTTSSYAGSATTGPKSAAVASSQCSWKKRADPLLGLRPGAHPQYAGHRRPQPYQIQTSDPQSVVSRPYPNSPRPHHHRASFSSFASSSSISSFSSASTTSTFEAFLQQQSALEKMLEGEDAPNCAMDVDQ